MKLPNAERALVERKKIVDYLLNAEHPDNGGKADFFSQLGFSSSDWTTLADALRLLETSQSATRETALTLASRATALRESLLGTAKKQPARERPVSIAPPPPSAAAPISSDGPTPPTASNP